MASEAEVNAATQAQVAEAVGKAEPSPKMNKLNQVSEEKKYAAPGEDDGAPGVAAFAVEQETIEEVPVPVPAKSPETGVVSPPPEVPKQTLKGQAAMHSKAAAKVAAGASKTSEDGPVSPENNRAHNDDEDSSNDDSSYFADPNNLPSPGEAGRKYSFGSHASANRNNAAARESDASLSLSDDSDDDHAKNAVYTQSNPEVFPQQRITRMHSVGSLVSTSTQNETDNDDLQPGGKERPGPHPIYTPHGAHYPVPHGSIPPVVSDYRQYQQHQGYPYQQPQIMSQQQQNQWMASLSNGPPPQNVAGVWSNGGGSLQYQEMNGGNSQPRQNVDGRNVPDKTPQSRRAAQETKKQTIGGGYVDKTPPVAVPPVHDDDENFKVYWQRWLMLMYMSVLNLMSDWTCYSVAPIALLTQEAFGDVDPEQLVTIFLAANAVASALEPIILSRLGLRRTVLFGALLLMTGSIVKSGGMPPIIQADLEKGHCELQLYLGFFLVGLSQPLYQCTPALLSASWFPEQERTMATGVALNSNQLGIGCAFVFGTLLVASSDDIPAYFGLLSIISTIAFFGTLFQFDDAPPTPPSDSARVMRGTLEVNLPSVQTILESIGVGNSEKVKRDVDKALKDSKKSGTKHRNSTGKARRSTSKPVATKKNRGGPPAAEKSRHKSRGSSSRRSYDGHEPSAAFYGTVSDIVSAPSPMMPGSVGGANAGAEDGPDNNQRQEQPQPPPGYPYGNYPGMMPPPTMGYPGPYGSVPQGMPGYPPYQPQGYPHQGYPPQGYGAPGYPSFGYPPNPQFPQYLYPPQGYQAPPPARGAPTPSYQHQPLRPDLQLYSDPYSVLPPVDGIDMGAEPVLTITPHHLDIDIRDDQIILAIRACFARPGFIHSLVAFTVSGIVINTLSTYMDYLVRLNGAGREYTGIIGGSFQVVIMISSLIMGSLTDKSRAYYSVTIGMLVIGAFGLAECGVSLNADRGSDLRVALIVVAALVGPLQPVSTELGVEVVYPLSENTVLVIQQLFSNLLSALFIPLFKELKDIGISEDEGVSQPEYTFSFYLLIVLHAAATVFVATFNGRYLRYEHELQKKDEKDRRRQDALETASVGSMGSYQPSLASGVEGYDTADSERQQLVPRHQIV